MEESRKLSGKDLITIGIFSAIYFVLNLAAMITGFVPVLWLLLPGVTGIVTGIPFLLMASKVRKPGAVLIRAICPCWTTAPPLLRILKRALKI